MGHPTIYVDMDCVIADFIAGAAAAHGLTPEAVYAEQPAGEYHYTAAVGRAKGAPVYGGKVAFGEDDFWAPINAAGAAFWDSLPVLPWAHELLGEVARLTDDWYVLTAPARNYGECVAGKHSWLARLLGVPWTHRMIPTPHKWMLAGPGRVLIDDSDANLMSFAKNPRTKRDTGSITVCLPAHHNHMHHRKDDPMGYVRARLEMLR